MSSSCSKKNSKALTAGRARRVRGRSTETSAEFTATESRRSSSSDEISEKLAALKNLIAPATRTEIAGEGGEVTDVDNLFLETADYILQLRAQVVVLQRFIQLSSTKDGGADVNAVF